MGLILDGYNVLFAIAEYRGRPVFVPFRAFRGSCGFLRGRDTPRKTRNARKRLAAHAQEAKQDECEDRVKQQPPSADEIKEWLDIFEEKEP